MDRTLVEVERIAVGINDILVVHYARRASRDARVFRVNPGSNRTVRRLELRLLQ